jgi:iron-sulfur cluster assembly protein
MSREPQMPAAESPVNVTERASRAVKTIVNEKRVDCLKELAPDLVGVYNAFATQQGRGPTVAELAGAAKMSEADLLARLGTAALGHPEHLPQEYRDAHRELSASLKRSPTAAELAERAGQPEAEVLQKIGNSAAVILGTVFLRLRVVGGGCSGFQYKLDLDPTLNPKLDEGFDILGVPVAVDRRSMMYLNGVVVDYHEDLNRRGFSVTNPSAKSTCGCGSSFSM